MKECFHDIRRGSDWQTDLPAALDFAPIASTIYLSLCIVADDLYRPLARLVDDHHTRTNPAIDLAASLLRPDVESVMDH
jgi:hypothetical protein